MIIRNSWCLFSLLPRHHLFGVQDIVHIAGYIFILPNLQWVTLKELDHIIYSIERNLVLSRIRLNILHKLGHYQTTVLVCTHETNERRSHIVYLDFDYVTFLGVYE